MPFSIAFNNPLDDDKFDDAQLTITPEIPDVKIVAERQPASRSAG